MANTKAKKKTTKKKTSSSKTKYVGKSKNYNRSFYERNKAAIMFLCFLIGVVLLCFALIRGYNYWEKARGVLFSFFGIGYYVLIAELFYLGYKILKDSLNRSFAVTIICGILSVAAFSSVFHLIGFSINEGGFDEWKNQFIESVTNSWNCKGDLFCMRSGVLGSFFGGAALHTCGKAGGLVVIIAMFLVSFFFFLNIDNEVFREKLTVLIEKMKEKFALMKESGVEKKADKAQKRAERKEQKELERAARAREEKENDSNIVVPASNIPESFDFNETEIEYDQSAGVDSAPSDEVKFVSFKDAPFTIPDSEKAIKPLPRKRTSSFKVDIISESNPDTFGKNQTVKRVNRDASPKQTPLSEKVETPIKDKGDDLSNDAQEIVKDAAKTANARLKKNIDEVSSYVDEKKKAEYQLPPIECLNEPKFSAGEDFASEMRVTAKKLVDILRSFGVETTLIGVSRGPSVTRYELSPAPGVKISKITNLADDIALGLASSGVRIEAPIPNKSAVGIEVPNKSRATVTLREIISSNEYKKNKGKLLTVALGKDITGNISCADLSKMPHLLIAGTTGSGKSVCLNGMIASILYNATPSEVKLLMIDPKQVEFTVYNGIPHLLVPVISDARKAAGSLAWAVSEMDSRYKTFAQCGVRDIGSFNKYIENHPELSYMPQIVIFIDELNDLMMVSPKEVEDSICRLAQKARAAGMHLVVATQRPSVDVITGIIKANIPSRLSLAVSSQVDSRTVLDAVGAEKLLGNGDMLFNPVGVSKPVRIQGAYLSDAEIERIVTFIKNQENAEYDSEIMDEIERNAIADKKKGSSSSASAGTDESDGQYDDMLEQAVDVITELNSASTTVLQRKLRVGYARAARIMDELEQLGYVSAAEGNNKPRRVLVTRSQFLEMRAGGETYSDDDDYDILSD